MSLDSIFKSVPTAYIDKIAFLGIILSFVPLSPSNVTVLEVVVTVVLAVAVCAVAGLLMATGFYRDFWAFWFCFVVATAHFSLVKVTSTFHSLTDPVFIPFHVLSLFLRRASRETPPPPFR